MFSELVQAVKALPIEEVRSESPEHADVVITMANLKIAEPILEKHLGKAIVLEPGVTPDHIINFMMNYGGVQPGQGLYFLKKDGVVIFAMIWPWNNQISATLKLRQVKSA